MEEKTNEPQVESAESYPGNVPPNGRRPYRSLFWPVVLIGGGIIWLLLNLGIIQHVSFWGFLRLWPLLLVFIGLDILFGRRWPALGALIGLAAVGGVILLMMVGPVFGRLDSGPQWIFDVGQGRWTGEWNVQTAHFEEAIDGARSAHVTLDGALWPVTVEALSAGSNNLIEADIAYVGEPIFDVSGGSSRSVTVGMQGGNVRADTAFDLGDYTWEISLSPDVPIDLNVNSGFGDGTFNLRDLQLAALTINGGFGGTRLLLPATDSRYDVDLNSGAGGVNIEMADGADIDMTINGGFGETSIDAGRDATLALAANMGAGDFQVRTGEGTNADLSINGGFGGIIIDTPGGAGVRLTIRSGGFGDVNVPSDFVRVEGGGDDFFDNEGTWESPNFGGADYQVTITIDSMGAGDVTIRR